MPSMLIDAIFRGSILSVKFDFLIELIANSQEVRFNYPEDLSVSSFDELIKAIRLNDNVDLAFCSGNILIIDREVRNVFINFARTDYDIELLFFFDIKDIEFGTDIKNFGYLEGWMEQYKMAFGFDYYVCQMDNASKDEYYFDSHGPGPLFSHIVAPSQYPLD